MAKACIVNINRWGEALLAKLKTEGRIEDYWQVEGTPTWCFNFNKELEIDLADWLEVTPDYAHNTDGKLSIIVDQFKRYIVLSILRTVKGAEVMAFSPTHLVLVPAEKEARVCIRLTPEQKQQLEQQAQKEGLSLSEYIRRRLGLA